MPVVMEKCASGRGSIGRTLAFLDTQQPFAYVHLLGILCQFVYLSNGVAIAFDLARDSLGVAQIVASVLRLGVA